MNSHSKGFTLLELLVAMSIFSFMSIMAYGGLSNILTSDKVLEEKEQRLKTLERAMMFIELDFRQMVARPRRAGYDQFEKALIYGLDSEGVVEFTRAGNSNPAGLVRSSLQRVRYNLEDKKLSRMSWSLVDHIDAEPINMPLLDDVELFELRLLNSSNEWQINWGEDKEIPRAIEVTLDHKYWGKIIRLIPIK